MKTTASIPDKHKTLSDEKPQNASADITYPAFIDTALKESLGPGRYNPKLS